MIKYQLVCAKDHEFEGWFQSSESFSEQSEQGLVSCPMCNSNSVRRALMAPNLASPKTRKSRPPVPQPTVAGSSAANLPAPTAPAAASMPGQSFPPEAVEKMAELLGEMRNLQNKIKAECRDVGKNFAEEARKIHYGEVEPEGIYGEVTSVEREQLDEEGIEVLQMPWLPKDN
jgi:hypothetical protein